MNSILSLSSQEIDLYDRHVSLVVTRALISDWACTILNEDEMTGGWDCGNPNWAWSLGCSRSTTAVLHGHYAV